MLHCRVLQYLYYFVTIVIKVLHKMYHFIIYGIKALQLLYYFLHGALQSDTKIVPFY